MREERDELVQATLLEAVGAIEAQGAALAAQGEVIAAQAEIVTELTRGRPKVSGETFQRLQVALASATKARDTAAKVLDAFVRGATYQRLAAFAVEVTLGKKYEAERSLREHEVKMRDWQVEAEEARRQAAEAPPRDSFGFPIIDGRPVAPGKR
jgi:hypothetical protein